MIDPDDVIYLDHAATAPPAPGVIDAVQRSLADEWANPDSRHRPARRAAHVIEQSARTLADCIGADPRSLVFTSGATESINTALRGVTGFIGDNAHVVSVTTEHRATLDVLDRLEAGGVRVTRIGVDDRGRPDFAELAAAVADDATLVSIMHVNNETGVIAPIAEIGALCDEAGAALHVDAAQGFGRLPIDVSTMNIDLLSLSAHKIGGPKGIGALYVRPGCGLQPLVVGGGQQRGLRSGTMATHQIAGFAAAARAVDADREAEQARLARLRERLWQRLAELDGVHRNGRADDTAAPFLNVSVDGVHGAALLAGLTEGTPALAVSTGSACRAAHGESSHVMRALGHSPRRAGASIRFSLGDANTASDIDRAGVRFTEEVGRLRTLAQAS